MRLDKKALGGFYELMLAMMIACIAISSFLGIITYEKAYSEQHHSVRTDFLDSVTITDGKITGITEYDIEYECQTNGYHSMVVVIDVAGDNGKYDFRLGEITEGKDSVFTNGMMKINSDDGTSVMANFEVIAFV